MFPIDPSKESDVSLSVEDPVSQFVADCVVPSPGSHFTLADAREAFMNYKHYNGQSRMLKTDLISILGTICHSQIRKDGDRFRNLFINFKLV
jgi:phage/plasmid-associated DNA primase